MRGVFRANTVAKRSDIVIHGYVGEQSVVKDDVGNVALFLASDLSRSITGETIHVDAGFNAIALV